LAGLTNQLLCSNKDTYEHLGLSVESTKKMVEWVQYINIDPQKIPKESWDSASLDKRLMDYKEESSRNWQ